MDHLSPLLFLEIPDVFALCSFLYPYLYPFATPVLCTTQIVEQMYYHFSAPRQDMNHLQFDMTQREFHDERDAKLMAPYRDYSTLYLQG
jgi:hypothetical protein